MNADKDLGIQTRTAAAAAIRALGKEYPERELTGAMLQAAFAVHNALGAGFLKRAYSNALAVEWDTNSNLFKTGGCK